MKWIADSPLTNLRSPSSVEFQSEDTRVCLLTTGEDIARATCELIESAEKEVISVEFLLRDDEFGLTKMSLLRKKVREGKRVIVHVDAFHLLVDPALVFHLINEGVEFTIFNRLTLKSLTRFSYRNHCKFLIIDGKIVKTGDSNTGNEYVAWGDGIQMKSLDVVILGPIAEEARRYSQELAESALTVSPEFEIAPESLVLSQRKQIQTFTDMTKTFFRALQIQMDAPENITRPQCILITPEEMEIAERLLDRAEQNFRHTPPVTCATRPVINVSTLRFFRDPIEEKGVASGVDQAVLDFLTSAQEELIIVSPYMILTPSMKSALSEVLDRGVRVRFYTNSLRSTDNETTQWAYEYRLEEWSQLGPIEIHEYEGPETLHAKFLVADGSECMIMSYNLDWRSELKNLETAIRFLSPSLSVHLEKWIEDHREQFKLVVHGNRLHKEPLGTNDASHFFKKIIIQSIEKHL